MIKPIYLVAGVIFAIWAGVMLALYSPKTTTSIPPSTSTSINKPIETLPPSTTNIEVNIVPATKNNKVKSDACTRDAIRFCKVEYLSYSANTKMLEPKKLFQQCMSRHYTELSKECKAK